MSNVNILVSISCITFNHVNYIRECLDGFLMQKTNFAFEILIHDDASTDGTTEIIKEFELNYPDIIYPMYELENQWCKGKRGSAIFNFPRAKGKYIALCEGDDYWIDPLKLQKQVDFMEMNDDFGLVHTGYQVINASNIILPKYNRSWKSGNVFEQIIKGKYTIVTATVLFRTLMYKELALELVNLNFHMGDKPMWIEFSRISKIKYIDEITTSYRVLANSASHSDDIKKVQDFCEEGLKITRYYYHKYNLSFDEKSYTAKLYGSLIKECYKKNNFALAYEYYKKMISTDVRSALRPTPLMFLLGSRFKLFRNAISLIYRFNR